MANPKIKFSHTYGKLRDTRLEFLGDPIKTAKLLQVISIAGEQLTKEFVNYDTDNGKYQLRFDTLYMMLIFLRPDGHIFTTLRPQFGQFGNKMKYYSDLIGKEFEIIITEKEVHHA